HIFGKLEAQLEGALGDAAMEEFAVLLLGRRGLGTLDGEVVLLGLDHEVALGKAGDGDRDAVGIVTDLFDVVGRVGLGLLADEAIEAIEQPVETDGRTVEGGEIVGLHGTFSSVSNVINGCPTSFPVSGESSFPGVPVPGTSRRTALR